MSQRVCIVHPGGLGDVVLALDVANALKRDDPARRIRWVAEPMPARILLHHPAVDEVVVHARRRGARGAAALARAFRGRGWDVTLNPQFRPWTLLPVALSRAPVRIGYDAPWGRRGVRWVLNRRIAPRHDDHVRTSLLRLLEPLGVAPPERPEWRIAFTEEERAAARAFHARQDGRPVAVIVPACNQPIRNWPPERWAQVAGRLDREFGFRVALLGGRRPLETSYARAIVDSASPPPLDAMGLDVRAMAAILAGCGLVLGPSTGPLHVACALGVPVIGLHGPTRPHRWGPVGRFEDLSVDARAASGAPPGADPNHRGGGRMEWISVDDVMERVALAVSRYPATAAASR